LAGALPAVEVLPGDLHDGEVGVVIEVFLLVRVEVLAVLGVEVDGVVVTVYRRVDFFL
jgi:hypothetical protein